jgi:hypothetical protein
MKGLRVWSICALIYTDGKSQTTQQMRSNLIIYATKRKAKAKITEQQSGQKRC